MRFRQPVLRLVTTALLFVAAAHAQETGRIGVVIARGDLRQQIKATPILERPNRPLHFYGNTVRRAYYRGTALPSPGEQFLDTEPATARP